MAQYRCFAAALNRRTPGAKDEALAVAEIDRLAVRQRPNGWPIMHQTWDNLLFLHWPVDVALLRRLIPSGLEIDTWDDNAWVSVTPLSIYGMRPALVPPVPALSRTLELNVRTYVCKDGVPGIWFFSLDASNWFAVWGARFGFALPYYHAAMTMRRRGETIQFRSHRVHSGAMPSELHATWQLGSHRPPAAPGTLDFFLIERYCLFAASGNRLYRARIFHPPWSLRTAVVQRLSSNVFQAQGLLEPKLAPLVHAQAKPLHVRVWPPQHVG